MPALSESLNFIVQGSSTVSITYPNTGTSTMIYFSDKSKGDGYYGNSDGAHTVMYTTSADFVGTLTTQASLATDPAELDWFNVTDTSISYTELNDRNYSKVDYFNFTGNFVWVRAKLEINSGSVESILYNH
jgi:hypothetical protein